MSIVISMFVSWETTDKHAALMDREIKPEVFTGTLGLLERVFLFNN